MKKLSIFAAMLVLSTSLSFAKEREFRINRLSAKGGYAIAWGIPGQKIDFEKLEENPETAADFVHERYEQLHNYLVDLETDSILVDLSPKGEEGSDFLDISFGAANLGNHFGISLASLPIDDAAYGVEGVAVINHMKWSNGIASFVLMDRVKAPKIIKNDITLQEKIEKAINSKLTVKQRKLLEERAATYEYESVFDAKLGSVAQVKIYASIPKSEDDGYEVVSKLKISFKDNELKVTPLSATFKKSTY